MTRYLNDISDVTAYVRPKLCKYYHPHMNTIGSYINCLYEIEDGKNQSYRENQFRDGI